MAQFARQLRDDILEKRSESEPNAPLADEEALAEVMLGYLEEAGLIEDYQLCPYQDSTGRSRCQITGYSLPDEGSRLDLFVARFVPEKDGATLPASEVTYLAGRAARFFIYAAQKDTDRFKGNDRAVSSSC